REPPRAARGARRLRGLGQDRPRAHHRPRGAARQGDRRLLLGRGQARPALRPDGLAECADAEHQRQGGPGRRHPRQAGQRPQALHRLRRHGGLAADPHQRREEEPQALLQGQRLLEESMAKAAKPHFFCTACGNEEARWFGRCPSCGAWNTASEAPAVAAAGSGAGAKGGRAEARERTSRARWAPASAAAGPRPLAAVEVSGLGRLGAGRRELDRVLGGGLATGSLLLVGGDPGIGKSTLLLQMAIALARPAGATGPARRVLYVAGEESEEQVRMRATRLGAIPEALLILCETDLEAVLEAAAQVKPEVMVVDSIQTIARSDLEGSPGTVTQMRECGLALLHYAKATRTSVLLVGHVTKDGTVAGPRVLEHMVDDVLYLEGERYQHYRVLRAAKNRFGATHELGVFEMTDRGLAEVANPSAAFLS